MPIDVTPHQAALSSIDFRPVQPIVIKIATSSQLLKSSVQRAGGPSLTDSRSPLQNTSAPKAIGPTTDMTRPLPLQLANPLSYVGDLGSPTDFPVANFVPKRDSQHSSLHSALRDFTTAN
ncbi:jg914 [Pararge aegeria aegeria]|uniref:Jg914 protein n=1 Tax=Pararge aegeria aegeria TaxID=348720 RepID=A0A8S4QWE4_9NEOP|nr:jg914 [Pararge aegeria aegeria]